MLKYNTTTHSIYYFIDIFIKLYIYIYYMFSFKKKSNFNECIKYPENNFTTTLYTCAKCNKIIIPNTEIYRGWDISFCTEKCREKYQSCIL